MIDRKPKPSTTPGTDEARKPTVNRRAFYIGLCIVIASLLSGLATGLILTGLSPIVPSNSVVLTTLFINLILIVAMVGVIAWQLTGLWRARQQQAAGSRLHARIVGLFSVIAVVPAIVLAIFASISLDRGLDHWFSKRTKTIIENSLGVTQAYVQEHGQILRTDSLAMARDLDAASSLQEVKQLRLSQQAGLRGIPLAYLLDGTGKPVATAAQSAGLEFLAPPKGAMKEAASGHAVSIEPGSSNRVAAIKKLESFPGLYLYVARLVEPKVIRHLRRTQEGVAEYAELERRRAGIQIAFGLMYVMIALTMLLAAVWIGLWFSSGLVAPIRRLIGAAQQVSEGELTVQVPLRRGEGDLGQLSTAFNRMTSQLRLQRDELVTTNSQLRERRRFIEAVLSGVSAGVVGLDKHGKVTLANPSAEELLGHSRTELVDHSLAETVPELAELVASAEAQVRRDRYQDQVHITVDGAEHILAVQVTREQAGDEDDGFVITFDDITELVTAQRTSAWADVARRIAHEIKNPLTPIQLSAERLRRKYGDAITSDREVFDRCTETIIRQVGDIGRMVDEFSSFARMPDPVMEVHDITEIAREVVFLIQVAHPDIHFEVNAPDQRLMVNCDRRLISQGLTNLVKNATEAIAAVLESDETPPDYKGHVEMRLSVHDGWVDIRVIDNGCGLPKKNRRRLVEPYMTTRAKGTGIGLAVVQKLTEQHGGRLYLEDAPTTVNGKRGACIRVTIPLLSDELAEETAEPGESEHPGDGVGESDWSNQTPASI
ncbi:MAG: PAS domain-containing sensor histidine kinase [Hyphomicrobiaceae bacterium]